MKLGSTEKRKRKLPTKKKKGENLQGLPRLIEVLEDRERSLIK